MHGLRYNLRQLLKKPGAITAAVGISASLEFLPTIRGVVADNEVLIGVAAKANPPAVAFGDELRILVSASAVDTNESPPAKVSGDGQWPAWANGREVRDRRAATDSLVRLALAALNDPEASVRLAAVNTLAGPYPLRDFTPDNVHVATQAVKKLTKDSDAAVRASSQVFLGNFLDRPDVLESIAGALEDSDAKVRDRALKALETSPQPATLATLQPAFKTAHGKEALRLLALLFEQEDASLAATLLPNFRERSTDERLAILTAIAGHIDQASFELVKLGLTDGDIQVQRAALLRLLSFPEEAATPLASQFLQAAPHNLEIAEHVRRELRDRKLFAFAAESQGGRVAGRESRFPSQNGTVPMVSPDGRWIVLMPVQPYGKGALVIDFELGEAHAIDRVGPMSEFESWRYRKCRWNPWSQDGSRFAFIRDDQVWMAKPDGREPKQLTFDSARKLFPTFSRDDRRIAYVTWQPYHRRHFSHLGPTDVWILDVESTLAVRGTGSESGRIHCLDWLDNDTVIFDRLDPNASYKSTLSILSLKLLSVSTGRK